jgi:ribosome biogenesis protein MAK21
MAKSTKGPGKGSKQTIKHAKPAAEKLPSFDEKALLALTGKLEKGFGTSKAPQNEPSSNGQSQKKTNNASRPDQSKSKNKGKAPEPSKGNKRDARGNRKPPSGESANGSRAANPQNGNTKDEKELLLQEILALGGSEEDLQLVADALSDDEDLDAGSSAPPDKSFRADLAKFVAGLGIDTKAGGDASEPESSQEEVEDEWESSDAESSSEPASAVKAQQTNSTPAKPIPEDKSQETSSLKGAGRLVGTSSLRVIALTNPI